MPRVSRGQQLSAIRISVRKTPDSGHAGIDSYDGAFGAQAAVGGTHAEPNDPS